MRHDSMNRPPLYTVMLALNAGTDLLQARVRLSQFGGALSRIKGISMNKELFDKGLAIRKSVIGAEFVDKALATADDFNMPLQELVTEYCWGAVWGREGLTKKTRSLLNIAMLSTLNRPHELKVHVKGAIRNGASKDEIRETLLQVAIYAGVPAAVDSFRIAKEALAELPGK
jgi:4-carboxymuconolactone decarboxylase